MHVIFEALHRRSNAVVVGGLSWSVFISRGVCPDVHFAGLSYSTDDASLKNAFNEYGAVAEGARLPAAS